MTKRIIIGMIVWTMVYGTMSACGSWTWWPEQKGEVYHHVAGEKPWNFMVYIGQQ